METSNSRQIPAKSITYDMRILLTTISSKQNRFCTNLILAFIAFVLLNASLHSCTSRHSTLDTSEPPFSKAYNIETTEMLLRFLTTNPSTIQLSDELGEKLQSRATIQYFFDEYPDCWQTLQSKLIENDNLYTLTSGDNGDMPNSRKVDDSYVEIRFPDGYQVTLFFYQSRIVSCQLLGH